jgi:hypothetical protein
VLPTTTHAPSWQVSPSEHDWHAEPNEPHASGTAPPWHNPAASQHPVAQVELSHFCLAGPQPERRRSDAPSAKVTSDLFMVLA